MNNSNFVIASQSFNLKVEDEAQLLNSSNDSSSESLKIEEKAESNENEVVYKPTTLPKAGGTIYFLILPVSGILILIYCILKKKDENF